MARGVGLGLGLGLGSSHPQEWGYDAVEKKKGGVVAICAILRSAGVRKIWVGYAMVYEWFLCGLFSMLRR